MALADQILRTYRALPAEEKRWFLEVLAERFGPELPRLDRAIEEYRRDPGASTAASLHQAAEPRRQELFRRLNAAPGGTLALIRMREDVLRGIARSEPLRAIDADFVHLFSSWFNSGFLDLRRIDWSTPARVLQKIIQYEAVHAIASWDDLQRRLDPTDRRCFAFFHPRLSGEPLIFVEVALTEAVPDAIAPLLAESSGPADPERAATAVFYSISNCQPGLRGVSLGNFLIKQVIDELKRELPGLRTFVTLSPVPGFAAWLRREREAGGPAVLSSRERAALGILDHADWINRPGRSAARAVLVAAAAEYLARARNPSGKPLDPVARLHLNNGARLEKIHWLADLSSRGLSSGLGFMVNYIYDPASIVENHERFAEKGEVVMSPSVRKLLPPPRAVAGAPPSKAASVLSSSARRP